MIFKSAKDREHIRNEMTYAMPSIIYRYYEDDIVGEWLGNIEVATVDERGDCTLIRHCTVTLDKPRDFEWFKEYVEDTEKIRLGGCSDEETMRLMEKYREEK